MMSRVSGLILAALSVETIQDGISASIVAGQFEAINRSPSESF
jgi:hypothetical protein